MSQRILKEISYGDDAKSTIISTVNKVADLVGSTMGFRGQNVLIEDEGGLPYFTSDGHDTMESIFFNDPLESLAAEVLKEASRKTVDHAGDNTTLTIVLSRAFVNYANEAVKSGKSPIDVKADIEKSKDLIIDYLHSISIKATPELIYSVAKTSAHGDEDIAQIVSDAFNKAGENGNVAHFRSDTDETKLEYIDGSLVEAGYADDQFVNVFADRTCFYDNPIIVASDINFKTGDQILPFLKYAVENDRSIVFISAMEFYVKEMILKNVRDGKLKAVVINPPSHGKKKRESLQDIAMFCGTNMISTLSGDRFENRYAEFLGSAKSISVGKTDTVIVPSEEVDRSLVNGKIEELKAEMLKSEIVLEKIHLKDRISKLHGGVSIIKVGGHTPSEIRERLARFDDAVKAVKSAVEEGVVAGGGSALVNCLIKLEGLDDVTRSAIKSPMEQIIKNASVSKDKFDMSVLEYPNGYDVKNYCVTNMIEAGIVDTVKGIRYALTNAVSVSNSILMTNFTITNKRKIDGI